MIVSNNPWNNPNLQSGDVKFEQPGTSVTGIVMALEPVYLQAMGAQAARWVMRVDIQEQDGRVRSFKTTTTQLADRLSEIQPLVGDWLHVRYDGQRQLGGGQSMKLYTVDHRRHPSNGWADGKAVQPTPEPAAAQAPFTTTHEQAGTPVPPANFGQVAQAPWPAQNSDQATPQTPETGGWTQVPNPFPAA